MIRKWEHRYRAPVASTHWVDPERCMVPVDTVNTMQAVRTGSPRVHRVSGRSGSLPMAKRWWRACEEAATKEQTPEPQRHPLRQGCYSGARDPRAAWCAGVGHAPVEMMKIEC